MGKRKQSKAAREEAWSGEGSDGHDVKKRRQEKEPVRFSEEDEVHEYDDEDIAAAKRARGGGDDDELEGVEIEGDRITRVEGEEDDTGKWSDEENAVEIEPFNLKEEQKEGYFDSNGHYVENRFKKGVKDAWLDEYDEKWATMFKGKKDTDTTEAAESTSPLDEPDTPVDKALMRKRLASLLNNKETALSALRRYSGKGPNKEKDRDMEKFNTVTECADALLSAGCHNIYSDSREKILYELGNSPSDDSDDVGMREPTTGYANKMPATREPAFWEYKLKDGTTFGPYTSQDMASWKAQGYFSGDQAVLVRKVSSTENIFATGDEQENEGDFISSDEVDFTSYA
jgi:hypothetical protein